jgi:DNA-binding transcriptional MerR regulator/predicted transcriptional regulator YdeE
MYVLWVIEMKNRFKIGEMSKLHKVPVKTLRYYDEIGLFKPIEIEEDSGYRYYSTEQFEQLNTINYLKFLGFSLKEIQTHLEKRDAGCFLDLLKKQKQITDDTIIRLQTISNQFSKRINEIEQSLKVDTLEEPILKHISKRTIMCIYKQVCSDAVLEIVLRKLENQANGNPSLFIGKVGLTVAQTNLEQGKFDEYCSVFIVCEEDVPESELTKHFKAGDYACIYFRGTRSNAKRYYKMLLQFINTNGYEIDGDSIERMLIDQYITTDSTLHLTEIQIPIK